MVVRKLFRLFFPGSLLDPFNILGLKNPEEQPMQTPGSAAPPQRTPVYGARQPVKPQNDANGGSSVNSNEASPPNNVGSSLPGSANGDVILNMPGKSDGTTPGAKHHRKPIGEIEEGSNVTNSQQSENQSDPRTPLIPKGRSSKPLEIMKSIVYGGLVELVTSLSIVASAAAAGASTLKIEALGLANLVGGLILLLHNLSDLRNEGSDNQNEVQTRYQQLLGREENFVLHMIFAALSYIIFGLVPPAVYGAAFYKTDDRDFKLAAVAGSSLVCIIVLAFLKAYTRGNHKFTAYTKTVTYYLTGSVLASGIALGAGHLLERFIGELGWFSSNPAERLSMPGNRASF